MCVCVCVCVCASVCVLGCEGGRVHVCVSHYMFFVCKRHALMHTQTHTNTHTHTWLLFTEDHRKKVRNTTEKYHGFLLQ